MRSFSRLDVLFVNTIQSFISRKVYDAHKNNVCKYTFADFTELISELETTEFFRNKTIYLDRVDEFDFTMARIAFNFAH